jgi:hypothetical protein
MYSRLVVPLVCAAAIVFACGPRPHGITPAAQASMASVRERVLGSDGKRAAEPVAPRRHMKKGDTTRVDAALAVAPESDGVHLALRVVNLDAKQLEIDFPNGQTRDFAVLDASGKEVWRWSRGRLFTQTVQNKFLAGGDSAVFEERWRPAGPGVYTVVATLRSKNFPLERRTRFEVQPSTVAAVTSAESERQP